jgi:hypothetical protein
MTGSDVMTAKTGERGEISAFKPNASYSTQGSSVKSHSKTFFLKK